MAYFGEIASNKGIIELVNGYKKYISDAKDPLELHFFGKNTIGGQFIEIIKFSDKIKYLGIIPHNEIFNKILE